MKLYKLFAMSVALLAFTACSDDDDTQYNSNGNVTVAMKESTITFDEFTTSDVVNIPIVVNGNANGTIKVNLVVNATGTTGAVEDKDFYVTSKTIFIPDTKKEGNMELVIVNNRFKENDRTFTVSIQSAEGATVAQNANSTLVTIKDDDATLYGRLQGKWTFKAIDGFTEEGNEVSFRCKVSGLRPTEPGYGQYLFIEFPGSLGSSTWTNSIRCELIEQKEEDGAIAVLVAPYGQMIGTNIPITLSDSEGKPSEASLDMELCHVSSSGELTSKGSLMFKVMKNEAELLPLIKSSDTEICINAKIINPNGEGYIGELGAISYYSTVELTRD